MKMNRQRVSRVNICGIPHEVIYTSDHFKDDYMHMGEIDYIECKIYINEKLSDEHMEETLAHEIIHGILVHTGYSELSQDEKFVQCMANAIIGTYGLKGCDGIYEIEYEYEVNE